MEIKTLILDNKYFLKDLYKEIYNKLISLEKEYSNFFFWFFIKVVKDIELGKRKIILKYIDDEIAGIAILKDSLEEKKICTLRVIDKFKKLGIGKKLFIESFEILKTDHPLITVSSSYIHEYQNLFKYFNFNLEEEYLDYYFLGKKEYSFNGLLLKQNYLDLKNKIKFNEYKIVNNKFSFENSRNDIFKVPFNNKKLIYNQNLY